MPVELSIPSALAARLGLIRVSPGLVGRVSADAMVRALRCHGNVAFRRMETRHSFDGELFRIRTTMGGMATAMWLEGEEPPM